MIMTIDNEPLKGNEPISATVERVWGQIGMDRLSPAEQERFLAAETERIEDLIEVRVPDQIELTRLYRQQSGQQPDYLTTVGLINNARNQATAAVIEEELFSQLPDDEEELIELVLRLQPDEGVKLWLMNKVPGPGGLRLRHVRMQATVAVAAQRAVQDGMQPGARAARTRRRLETG